MTATVAELGGDDDLRQAVGLPLHADVRSVGVLIATLRALSCLRRRARGEVVLLPAVRDFIGGVATAEDVGIELELRGERLIEVAAEHSRGQDTVGITAGHTATTSVATAPSTHAHHEAELIAVLADVGEASVVRIVETSDDGELIVVSEAAEG